MYAIMSKPIKRLPSKDKEIVAEEDRKLPNNGFMGFNPILHFANI